MLTKQEISQAPKTLGLVSLYPTNMDYSDGYYRGVKDAARVIDERARDGVVCERRYIIRHADYPDPAAAHMMCSYLTVVGDTGYGHEGEYVWLDNKRLCRDGQCVIVTVREEKDDRPAV